MKHLRFGSLTNALEMQNLEGWLKRKRKELIKLMSNKSYTITAESSNCVIKLTGDLAIKVWNYILEDVVNKKHSDELDVAFKQPINSDMIVTEGYLGKI